MLESSCEDSCLSWLNIYSSTSICVLLGPTGSLYEGGLFALRASGSTFTFLTQILHPNIDDSGHVRAHFSDKGSAQQLLSLLQKPDWSRVVNSKAALLYCASPELFEQAAREWTLKYAC